MTENIVGKANVRLVGSITVGYNYNDLPDGTVFVYEIKGDSDDLFFDDFYVATFDNLSNEIVWGVGNTPRSALEDAERNWDRLGDEYPNPFREALEKLKEEGNNMLLNY